MSDFYQGLRGNCGPLYSSEDFLDDYTFQQIKLDLSDPSKFPGRMPRAETIQDIDDEMSYEDRIRLSFIKFDRFEACVKKVSLYEDPHGHSAPG